MTSRLLSIRHFIVVSTIALFLVLSACATVQIGRDFDLRTFESRIERQVSTKSDIKSWLGQPNSTGITVHTDGKRTEKWTYYYGSGKLPKLKNASLKILEIQFDTQGNVLSYNWTE